MQRRVDGSYLFSPTDLVNFLGCSHAAVLDIRSFSETLEPDEGSDADKLLRRKGEEHEAAYLQCLKDAGKTVAEIPQNVPIAERSRRTKEALSDGVDVIYQAALLGENWGGYADFLVKTNRPSALGEFSYEATNTKLARHPKVEHLLQLGVYSSLLAHRQRTTPAQCHLVLGDGKPLSFAVADFAAYVRHAQRRLEDFAASPPADSYPPTVRPLLDVPLAEHLHGPMEE
jgi:uncharacterized protein